MPLLWGSNWKLQVAAYRGYVDQAREALEKGADVNCTNDWGWTPLHRAASEDRVQVLRLLLQQPFVAVDVTNKNGQTPLHEACFRGNERCVKLLLQAGADVHVRSNHCDTPLHEACDALKGEHKAVVCVQLLFQYGAETNVLVSNKDGKLPLDIARESKFDNLVTILQAREKWVSARERAQKEARAKEEEVKARMKAERAERAAREATVRAQRKKEEQEAAAEETERRLAAERQEAAIRAERERRELARRQAHFDIAKDEGYFFYQLWDLPEKVHDNKSLSHEYQTLAETVCSLPTFSIFYTFLKASVANDVVPKQRAQELTLKALTNLADHCRSDLAIDFFKTILEKCQSDGLLLDETIECHKRMEHADFVYDMQDAIHRNTRIIADFEIGTMAGRAAGLKQCKKHNMKVLTENLELLDRNRRELSKNLDELPEASQLKMKVEAIVALVKAVLNAISLGLGKPSTVFALIACRVVDFGDVAHIAAVIQDAGTLPENDVDANAIQESFEKGKKLANRTLKSDTPFTSTHKFEKAVKKGAPMVAIALAAIFSRHGAVPESTDESVSTVDGPHSAGESNESEREISLFSIWPDAIFHEEQEDEDLQLHRAIKYSDKETLCEELISMRDDDTASILNKTDSMGRTALDLAAFTGQVDLVEMLQESGAQFSQPRAKMRVVAKKRAPMVDDYKAFIQGSIED